MTQYVYNGKLVRKTGRMAHKGVKQSSGNRRSRPTQAPKFLYEVTPAEGDLDWKEWVKDEDLYVVIETKPASEHPSESTDDTDQDDDDDEDTLGDYIQPPSLNKED